jgi:hypothetical protein
MKKSVLVLGSLLFLTSYPLESQGFLNKVKNGVSKEITGTNGADNSKKASRPEPACACENAKLIIDLGGKYNLDYSEISISMLNDGSMLIWDKLGYKYYIVKDGISQGPYDENDPKVKKFNSSNDEETDDNNKKGLENMYPDYLVKSGDKYLIKFGGKSYGPYSVIQDFAVTRSKDKFVAIVTEDIIMNEDQGKKMEEAMKNAKTDQERMDLAMKMQLQIQDKMMKGAGTGTFQPKLATNVTGAVYDPITWAQTRLDGKVKFDEIVLIAPDKIMDLKGKTLFSLNQSTYQTENLFVNSSNTRYATYNYGALTFSDNKTLSDLFNPYLIKTEGKVYLTYMYYSPGKDSIMQCAIPF